MESNTPAFVPASAPGPKRPSTLPYIVLAVVVALLIILAAGLWIVSRGEPMHYLESAVSAASLPQELKHALLKTSTEVDGLLYVVQPFGFTRIARGVDMVAVEGGHVVLASGSFGTSKIYLDGKSIVTASSSLLVTPAISSDGTTVAWGEIVAPHKLASFSAERVVVRTLADGKERAYKGVAPFFLPDGRLGRVTNEGVSFTDLTNGETKVARVPEGTAFAPGSVFTPSLVASPNGAYVGWTDAQGMMVVMRVNGDVLEPVLSRKGSSQYFALGNDALYAIVASEGKSAVERVPLSGEGARSYSLPSFLNIFSISL